MWQKRPWGTSDNRYNWNKWEWCTSIVTSQSSEINWALMMMMLLILLILLGFFFFFPGFKQSFYHDISDWQRGILSNLDVKRAFYADILLTGYHSNHLHCQQISHTNLVPSERYCMYYCSFSWYRQTHDEHLIYSIDFQMQRRSAKASWGLAFVPSFGHGHAG